jgi:uncharacterized protein DUF4345
MANALKSLAMATGVTCTAIGVGHAALGVRRSVPGSGSPNATIDSLDRFHGAVFAAYGLAWLWMARQDPVPAQPVRALAGTMGAGGVARLVSLRDRGRPHWFQIALTVVELAFPPVFLPLVSSDEHGRPSATGSRPGCHSPVLSHASSAPEGPRPAEFRA